MRRLTIRRYLPVLLTRMPCSIAEGEMQMTVGKMYSPDKSGGAIFAAWKYVGLQRHLSYARVHSADACRSQVDYAMMWSARRATEHGSRRLTGDAVRHHDVEE